MVLVAAGCVVLLLWFERSRQGFIVPALCVALLAGGLVWRLQMEPPASAEAVLAEQAERLQGRVDEIDRALKATQDLIRTSQTTSMTPAAPEPPPDALEPLRSAILGYVNALRSGAGVGELQLSGTLTRLANDRSTAQAQAGRLIIQEDGPVYRAALGETWEVIGENVGSGRTWQSVLDAFAASPGHADNMIDRRFERIGVGLAFDADTRLYVTLAFVDYV